MHHLFAVVVVLASCSSREREPAPTRASGSAATVPNDPAAVPTGVEAQAVGRAIGEHARAELDAGAAATTCALPAQLERVGGVGALKVSTFGGKPMHTAIANLDGGGQLLLLARGRMPAGRTNLRSRRDADDFTRPVVVELTHGPRGLDAVSGTLVIDETTPELVGHIADAVFRERAEDLSYVPNGCTTHVGRIDFRFRPHAP